jgi:hypothetical protein
MPLYMLDIVMYGNSYKCTVFICKLRNNLINTERRKEGRKEGRKKRKRE